MVLHYKTPQSNHHIHKPHNPPHPTTTSCPTFPHPIISSPPAPPSPTPQTSIIFLSRGGNKLGKGLTATKDFHRFIRNSKPHYSSLTWSGKDNFRVHTIASMRNRGFVFARGTLSKYTELSFDEALQAIKIILARTHVPRPPIINSLCKTNLAVTFSEKPASISIPVTGMNWALIVHSIIDIFDKLLLSPSRGPTSVGDGICLTYDSCYGNTPKLNTERRSYIRQKYGTNTISTHEDGTIKRAMYGTGSGVTTDGTPLRLATFFHILFPPCSKINLRTSLLSN